MPAEPKSSSKTRTPPALGHRSAELPRGRMPLATGVLLCLGIVAWAAIGPGRGIGTLRWCIIGISAGLACLAPIANRIDRLAEKLRRASRDARARTAFIVGVVSAGYFVLTALDQGRDLFPKTHDDCSYVIGLRMLAHGRLWMPSPPMPEFFDSFYILVKPVYCSIYFPGTALLYLPTIWLNWPTWVMPAMASGAAAAILYLIIAELLDNASALLAILLLASLSWFRVYTVLVTSHVPMLLMGLTMVYSWLRWREKKSVGGLIAIGVATGWGVITRPADALLFTLPIAVAITWSLRGAPMRRWFLTAGLILLALSPFLILQAIFDVGVTGNPLKTPYTSYLQQDQPGSSFGFHPANPAAQPASSLPEKRDFYANWVAPRLAEHMLLKSPWLWATRYLPMVIDTTMPCRLMVVLAIIGLLGLSTAPRRVLASTLLLFFAVYFFNPVFLEHYAMIAIPGVLMLVLLGGRQLAMAFPRYRRQISAAFVAVILASSLTGFWEINHLISPPETAMFDETFSSTYLRFADRDLSQYVQAPAVVLFTYHPGENFFEEPVYNTDVLSPMEAPIIRAHDLGPVKDREIFAYFGEREPDRVFWSFDPARLDEPLKELGTARELAQKR